MNIDEMISALEAVLFAAGDPLPLSRICQLFELEAKQAEELLTRLQERYDQRQAGIVLLRLDDAYQLGTRKEYAGYVRAAHELRRKTPLSQAAMEVLAVVAYNQPVTRAFIEQVRGVDCGGVISTLVERGLIEEQGRLELPGRPLLYGTTPVFLRCFGLRDLGELPPLPHDEQTQDTAQTILQDAPGSSDQAPAAAQRESAAPSDTAQALRRQTVPGDAEQPPDLQMAAAGDA